MAILPVVVRSLSPHIAIVGGGASGIFAAIVAAEANPNVKVTILEATGNTLQKVKISGGGRCNVMHNSQKPVDWMLKTGYPRGSRELTGLLHKRFTPADCQLWFESRGVQLKTEPDGRMFPVTDSSQTVLDALWTSAHRAGVKIQTREKVESITVVEDGSFCVKSKLEEEVYSAVILATGSFPGGYRLAESLGHAIVAPVPSLFTLSTKHAVGESGMLHGLSGISVPHARVSYDPPPPPEEEPKKNKRKKTVLQEEGPLLITHHGLTGPAALRLSAFGAREMAQHKYRGTLRVHWAPELSQEQVVHDLWQCTTSLQKKVATVCPVGKIPRRLWAALVQSAGFAPDAIWPQASKKLIQQLATQICDCPLELTGKGTFKEEFVTAGGISLKEIDMTAMQSKIQPGLFCCGELIDVDGVTGGFNFMNAWGTGYVAGREAAAYVASYSES
jgi:predicted Rossmann fold flavoprotein